MENLINSCLSLVIAVAPSALADLPAEGSIIFYKNGLLSKPVQRHTGSSFSHSAIVLYENGEPYVYESIWPATRRLPWEQYQYYVQCRLNNSRMRRLGMSAWIMSPKNSYSQDELARMKRFADSQLGRRYRARNWLRNSDSRGTHCSQFVSEVLNRSKRTCLYTDDYWKQSPYDVYRRILPTYAYLMRFQAFL